MDFNGIRLTMPDPDTGEGREIGKVTSFTPSPDRKVQRIYELTGIKGDLVPRGKVTFTCKIVGG